MVKKTRQELELEFELEEKNDELRTWVFILAVCLILIVAMLILIGIYPESFYKYRELKQELQSCQDQTETWTLKLSCYYDWEDTKINNTMEVEFDNYDNYLFALENLDEENCEVMK